MTLFFMLCLCPKKMLTLNGNMKIKNTIWTGSTTKIRETNAKKTFRKFGGSGVWWDSANFRRHHQHDSAMSVHPYSTSGRFTFTAEEQASISSGHQRIIPLIIIHHTLSKTNSLPLKMDGWKMKFPIGKAYFVRGYYLVSERVNPNKSGIIFPFFTRNFVQQIWITSQRTDLPDLPGNSAWPEVDNHIGSSSDLGEAWKIWVGWLLIESMVAW